MTSQHSDDDYRLPRNSRPARYVLRLAPDLESATFTGEETIEIEIVEPTDSIMMNAAELEVTDATITPGWASDGASIESVAGMIEFDEDLERIRFNFEDVLPLGHYSLRCQFRGTLNDKLRGFYRSTFTDAHGADHTIATTQFEDTDARRAFPCFDEPDRKASFEVTLDVASEMTAVSNGQEYSSTDIGNGLRRVRFEATIPMSTYLVAFVVGPLEATDPIDVDGVELRVLTVPGKTRLAGHALEAGAHALRFFTSYFDIAYPGNKLDLLALPDFAAGAMENLGCVTFREAILLADPASASRNELERLSEVVEHEIAHMWFGDLVTMSWWNGIWLNEAFATFMALCCLDDFRPEWEAFTSFGRSKAAAFHIDALHATRPIEFPVRRPDEAAAMFDILTYEKGASVLWMIEQYLGRDRFRAGVRRYLRAHLYGNTETSDLWDAIEAEAEEIPIRAIMDSWIFQGGFPLVLADGDADNSTVTFTQEPFSYLPREADTDSAIGDSWLIPIIAAPLDHPEVTSRVLLGKESDELAVESLPLVVNAGGSGFYRVQYDSEAFRALVAGFGRLSAVERFNLVSDTWSLILSGKSELGRLFELTDILAQERDPSVWSVVIGAIGLIDLLAPQERRDALASFTKRLLSPLFAQVGWQPRDAESEQIPLLRSSLVSTLGIIGRDEEVFERCQELFEADHHGGAPIDADLVAAVLSVVAHRADEDTFEAILERFHNPQNPNDQLRHLNAFSQLTDERLAARVQEMCLDDIRSQDAPYLLASMLRNRAIGRCTWSFISDRFDELVERFPENSIHRMLDGISSLAQLDEHGEPELAGEVERFCESHIEGARRRLIDQSLERLTINVRLAQRLVAELAIPS